jgi:hypothetical protein
MEKMAVVVVPNPSQRENEEEEVINLFYKVVEGLSREAREEFAELFSEELKDLISPTAVSKAKHGRIHLANKTIINVVLVSSRARKWVLRKAKEEAMRTLELVEVLEKKEPTLEDFAEAGSRGS